MKILLAGKIVLPHRVIDLGTIQIENGLITDIFDHRLPTAKGDGNDWILPGFIDVHLHGLGKGEPSTRNGLLEMAAFAPSTGVTRLCPTLGPVELPVILEYLKNIHDLVHAPPAGALIAGAHLEGPYMNTVRAGGMDINLLRTPDTKEVKLLLSAANGTLKIMTLSPEVPEMDAVIKLCKNAGCVISAGHTVCPAEEFDEKVEAGISHVCHLFDTFDGREVFAGVSQSCLADMVLINDRVTCEIIMDGIHVPAPLVKLAHRAAGTERIIAITDSMQGTGFPDGEYLMGDGRAYILTNGEVCRLKSNGNIVGSCLTMNQAFINMTEKFNFSAPEAARALATNPARLLGLEKETGRLETGLAADIAVLTADGTVKACFVLGEKHYEN